MFLPWLLKYSSFFITGVVTFAVTWLADRFIARRAALICYTSHQQYVTLVPAKGQPPIQPIGTFTLFLWNQGKAPSKEVHVGHYWLPAHNVYPDIPRTFEKLPGGGVAIRFATIPPKVLISISYLHFGVQPMEQILSYIGSEEGAAKRVPVLLQRIWPAWWNKSVIAIFFLGFWTLLTGILSLIQLLRRFYYK
jgi:hypothetical protein